MEDNNTFGFPFGVNEAGSISSSGGDEAIRGKIIQVLLRLRGQAGHFLVPACPG